MKFASSLLVAVVSIIISSGFAVAKPAFKSALGVANCAVCHADGKDKKEANPANALWKKAKDMSAKMAAGKGDFAGKKACNDCHKGKQKPAK